MTPWNPHAARSRWFAAPLADVTPRERALPWAIDTEPGFEHHIRTGGSASAFPPMGEGVADAALNADADLIAHAPTDLAAALDEIDALRAAMAASAEGLHAGTLTPREQRIYAAGFEFGRKAAAEGARLAAERGLAGEGT